MSAKIQIRRDTISNWSGASPTAALAGGEIGVAFEASGAVHGIKIGPQGGGNWNSLPYLNGTLPNIDVTGITDWNNSALRTTGRFVVNSSFASNGPAAPIAFIANDGRITCLCVEFGTSVLHIVTTEGNGTVPAKMLFRIYDGDAAAWREWTPLSIWASSATEGVNVVAKSITLKDAGTGLTVDGNSTLTGNVTVNGTTTLGNADADIVTVQAGTAANPIITTAAASTTGLYFPSAGTVGLSTGGTARVQVADASTTITNNLIVNGTLGAALNAGTFKITNMGDPTAAQDAVTKAYLESGSITQTAFVAVLGAATATIPFQVVGTATTGFSIVSQSLRSPSGTTWKGIAKNGTGGYCGITVTSGAAPTITDTGQGNITGYGAGAFFYCTLIRTA